MQPHGPSARFSANPATAYINDSVKFDASNSTSGWNGTNDMPIIEYRWTFGDGNDTTTSTSVIYHSYVEEGYYGAALSVYSPSATPELDISATQEINVTSIPNGDNSTVPEFPRIEGAVFFILILATVSLVAVVRKEFYRSKKRVTRASDTVVIRGSHMEH